MSLSIVVIDRISPSIRDAKEGVNIILTAGMHLHQNNEGIPIEINTGINDLKNPLSLITNSGLGIFKILESIRRFRH